MTAAQMLKMAGFPDTEAGRKAFYKKFKSKDDFDKVYANGGATNEIAFPQAPTANQYFSNTFRPNYPKGYYAEGGNTNKIAFPQAPTSEYFFSAYSWPPQYYAGGGLPNGANNMPCMECGGYMQDGGEEEEGGAVSAFNYGQFPAIMDMGGTDPNQQFMTPQQWRDYNTKLGYKVVPDQEKLLSDPNFAANKYLTFYNESEYQPRQGDQAFVSSANPSSVYGDTGYTPFIDYTGHRSQLEKQTLSPGSPTREGSSNPLQNTRSGNPELEKSDKVRTTIPQELGSKNMNIYTAEGLKNSNQAAIEYRKKRGMPYDKLVGRYQKEGGDTADGATPNSVGAELKNYFMNVLNTNRDLAKADEMNAEASRYEDYMRAADMGMASYGYNMPGQAVINYPYDQSFRKNKAKANKLESWGNYASDMEAQNAQNTNRNLMGLAGAYGLGSISKYKTFKPTEASSQILKDNKEQYDMLFPKGFDYSNLNFSKAEGGEELTPEEKARKQEEALYNANLKNAAMTAYDSYADAMNNPNYGISSADYFDADSDYENYDEDYYEDGGEKRREKRKFRKDFNESMRKQGYRRSRNPFAKWDTFDPEVTKMGIKGKYKKIKQRPAKEEESEGDEGMSRQMRKYYDESMFNQGYKRKFKLFGKPEYELMTHKQRYKRDPEYAQYYDESMQNQGYYKKPRRFGMPDYEKMSPEEIARKKEQENNIRMNPYTGLTVTYGPIVGRDGSMYQSWNDAYMAPQDVLQSERTVERGILPWNKKVTYRYMHTPSAAKVKEEKKDDTVKKRPGGVADSNPNDPGEKAYELMKMRNWETQRDEDISKSESQMKMNSLDPLFETKISGKEKTVDPYRADKLLLGTQALGSFLGGRDVNRAYEQLADRQFGDYISTQIPEANANRGKWTVNAGIIDPKNDVPGVFQSQYGGAPVVFLPYAAYGGTPDYLNFAQGGANSMVPEMPEGQDSFTGYYTDEEIQRMRNANFGIDYLD
jgi:hypothetical protein